jgi:hypothetical protein
LVTTHWATLEKPVERVVVVAEMIDELVHGLERLAALSALRFVRRNIWCCGAHEAYSGGF